MADAPESTPRPYGKTGLYIRAISALKLRDKRVERLTRRMRTVMDWLQPSDMPVARAWCELECLATRVYAELRDRGVCNGDGESRRLLNDYRKLGATQVILSRELGMTPASRVEIQANGTHAALELATAADKRLAALDGETATDGTPAPAAIGESNGD